MRTLAAPSIWSALEMEAKKNKADITVNEYMLLLAMDLPCM